MVGLKFCQLHLLLGLALTLVVARKPERVHLSALRFALNLAVILAPHLAIILAPNLATILAPSLVPLQDLVLLRDLAPLQDPNTAEAHQRLGQEPLVPTRAIKPQNVQLTSFTFEQKTEKTK